MDELQKFQSQPLTQELVQFENAPPEQAGQITDLIFGVLRHWLVIIITIILFCGAGAPAIWFLIESKFDTQAAIRISPIVSRIMYGDSESDRPMPNYDNFKNTEARRIGSDLVLNRVADELVSRGLNFFKDAPDPVMTLRQAVSTKAIDITALRNTEVITISLAGKYPREAEQIIDSFIRAYMAIVDTEERKGGTDRLAVLEEQRRSLMEKMNTQRETINKLSDEFGSVELTSRQNILLQTVGRLQDDLTGVVIRRFSLETQLQLQENRTGEAVIPNQAERKTAYINSNPTVQALNADIVRYEQLVMMGQQTLAPENPELKQRIEILDNLKERLVQRKKDAADEFDKNIQTEIDSSRQLKLADIKAELQSVIQYEERIRKELESQDSETISIGRKQRTIDDQKEQLALTKEMYNEITRRMDELNIERQRPARISVESYASSVPSPNKRIKLLAALGFGSIAAGIFFALLLEKADKSVRQPQDVVKRVGVRIIGTTTSPRHVEKNILGRQLMDDYQTIRANLGLMNTAAQTKIIVVTSPGQGDGKTTFSVNIATSFAMSGEKVLLIDGDLRKPDIAALLNLPEGTRGLQDLLFGKDLDKCVYSYQADSVAIDVLAADFRNVADALDLLDHERTGQCLKNASMAYDHVIIDTPPVLAFSDALLWAKLGDGVIITSFAEKTSTPDLREAIFRLEQINARVLGTVLNNVKSGGTYHRYGYGYGYGYSHKDRHPRQSRHANSRVLLTSGLHENKDKDENENK